MSPHHQSDFFNFIVQTKGATVTIEISLPFYKYTREEKQLLSSLLSKVYFMEIVSVSENLWLSRDGMTNSLIYSFVQLEAFLT